MINELSEGRIWQKLEPAVEVLNSVAALQITCLINVIDLDQDFLGWSTFDVVVYNITQGTYEIVIVMEVV